MTGRGAERRSPQKDSETLVLALRGAAGAKIFQCAQARERDLECSCLVHELFSTVKRWRNKDWVRPVPAAAVIPAVQVALAFIGSKTSVAGLASLL